jgi:hypothetical protein
MLDRELAASLKFPGDFLQKFLAGVDSTRSHIGNRVSSFSQFASSAMPQTMIPWRWRGVGAGVVPITLPVVTCAPDGATWVWIVRAAATVAIKATAIADKNFALLEIMFPPDSSMEFDRRDNSVFALHKTHVPHINL